MGGEMDGNDRDDERVETEPSEDRLTRRTFLKGAGALGAAGFTLPIVPRDWAFVRDARRSPATPIEHVIISCQENRSFDHYFGYAPWIGPFGPPGGYTQPDGQGGGVARIASRT